MKPYKLQSTNQQRSHFQERCLIISIHILEVLVKLRLQEHYGIIFAPSRSVTYVGGLQPVAVDVLMAYGWSIDIKLCGLAGWRKYHLINGLSLSLESVSLYCCYLLIPNPSVIGPRD